MNILKALGSNDRGLLEQAIGQRAKTLYLGEHIALTRVLGDLMMYVDTRDTLIAPTLMMNGFWEMWVTQAIARHIQPGMTCIDVGANVGYYTLLMAALAGSTGRVTAFDILPQHCKLLRRSAEINGLAKTVTVVPQAVGDRIGEIAIQIPQAEDGFGHFGNAAIKNPDARTPEGDRFYAGKVQGTTLDAWGGSVSCGTVDFIKVDVEGAEPLVWKGSVQLRQQHGQVICLEYEGWRPGYQEFLAAIRGEGYRVRFVDYDSNLADVPAEPDPERLMMLWVTQ